MAKRPGTYYGGSTVLKFFPPSSGSKPSRSKLGALQVAAIEFAENPPDMFPLYASEIEAKLKLVRAAAALSKANSRKKKKKAKKGAAPKVLTAVTRKLAGRIQSWKEADVQPKDT